MEESRVNDTSPPWLKIFIPLWLSYLRRWSREQLDMYICDWAVPTPGQVANRGLNWHIFGLRRHDTLMLLAAHTWGEHKLYTGMQA